MTRDSDGIHLADVFTGNRLMSTRPPVGTRDLEGALSKRPVVGLLGPWGQVMAWIRFGFKSAISFAEIKVHVPNGNLPYHEISIPAPRINASYSQIEVDQDQVVFQDNQRGDVFYSRCTFEP